MGPIDLQQAFGRIVRYDQNNNTAHLIMMVDDDVDQAYFDQFILEFLHKMTEIGLTPDDFDFQELQEQRTGHEPSEGNTNNVELSSETLESIKQRLQVELRTASDQLILGIDYINRKDMKKPHYTAQFGNPPYLRDMYIDILLDRLQDNTPGAYIIPINFATMRKDNYRPLRQALIRNGLFHVEVLPFNTFQHLDSGGKVVPVQTVTAIVAWDGQKHDTVEFSRDGVITKQKLTEDMDYWLLPFSDSGLSLYHKLCTYAKKSGWISMVKGNQRPKQWCATKRNASVAFNQVGRLSNSGVPTYTTKIAGKVEVIGPNESPSAEPHKERSFPASSEVGAQFISDMITSPIFALLCGQRFCDKNLSGWMSAGLPIFEHNEQFTQMRLLKLIGATRAEIQWVSTKLDIL